MVIISVHFFVVNFQNDLLQSLVGPSETQTDLGSNKPGLSYQQFVNWTKHKVDFWRQKAKTLTQTCYNLFLSPNADRINRPTGFGIERRSEIRFRLCFLFISLHYILEVLSMLEGTLEEVCVEVISVDNFQHGVSCCISHFKNN